MASTDEGSNPMRETIKRAGSGFGLHVRRQAIAYVALAVALGGSAYAGNQAGSDKVGGRDLKPVKVRPGDPVTIAPGDETTVQVTCKRGEVALEAGGNSGSGGEFGRAVLGGTGALGGKRVTGFALTVVNTSPTTQQTFRPEVACLRP
jgi:hypothetical protein